MTTVEIQTRAPGFYAVYVGANTTPYLAGRYFDVTPQLAIEQAVRSAK